MIIMSTWLLPQDNFGVRRIQDPTSTRTTQVASRASNELELASTVAMRVISLRIVLTRSGKTMVASSSGKTKPSISPTRTTSPRRLLLVGWWFKKNIMRMTMMMKMEK